MKDMQADQKVNIQYSEKYSVSSNYWKYSIGQKGSLEKLNVKAKKEELENQFNKWVVATPERKAKYGEALNMIKNNVYDLILMDIILGHGMNGIETTKEIRKMKGYDTLPIIAVTAYAMPEDKVKFIAEGMNNYISKPFDLNQFRKFIIELLQVEK